MRVRQRSAQLYNMCRIELAWFFVSFYQEKTK